MMIVVKKALERLSAQDRFFPNGCLILSPTWGAQKRDEIRFVISRIEPVIIARRTSVQEPYRTIGRFAQEPRSCSFQDP
jgi:hypothetical protein